MELGSKLHIKGAQSIAILGVPAGLTLDLPADTRRVKDAAQADVVIVFVPDSKALSKPDTGKALNAAREDRIAWLVYPKAGQLGTDLNRDKLAAAVDGQGIRPVRQISVDEVWSALRFRPS